MMSLFKKKARLEFTYDKDKIIDYEKTNDSKNLVDSIWDELESYFSISQVNTDFTSDSKGNVEKEIYSYLINDYTKSKYNEFRKKLRGNLQPDNIKVYIRK